MKGWLKRRGEGCGGDDEVRGQRSAPLLISPAQRASHDPVSGGSGVREGDD